jgi:membrane fusion protein, heavy metal efflux system
MASEGTDRHRMTFRAGLLTGVIVTAAVAGLIALAWAGLRPKPDKAEPAKPSAPAIVAKEEDLLTITLTADAAKRLRIETAKAEVKPVRRERAYGGEVTIPPGHTILVAAPLGGILKSPPGGVPRAGTRVKRGDPVFQFLPLLSPDARTTLATARVDAEGQVNTARTSLATAKVGLDRAQELLSKEAASRKTVEDAQAVYDLAQKALEAAQARLALLTQAAGDAEKGTAAPLTIEAPIDGMLRNVSALAEQNVPSGATLFEVTNLDPIWVRVPVFVGEVGDLDSDEAEIGPLTARPGTPTRSARPAVAPPSANPMAGTVDLYFTLSNADGSFIPGQRVGVTIPMREPGKVVLIPVLWVTVPLTDPKKSLTVPWRAVLFDINGGTWVYEQIAPRTYTRRRVQVRYVTQGTAVLEWGPKLDKPVVTVGAQELFGTEVGFGK